MQLLNVAPGALRPAARNANRLDEGKYRALVASIRRIGFVDPVLARELPDGYEVVDGHHRVRAAGEVGLDSVPTLVIDGDEDPRLVALALNRIRGETDLAVAAEIVQDLLASGLDEVDLSVSGFSDAEIRELAAALQPSEPTLEDVGSAGVPEEVGTRVAKPWLLEITFRTKDDLLRAKRALRKAAGRGGDLSDGLLALVGQES